MQGGLGLRGEDLARDHIGGHVRPKVREEEREPVDGHEEPGGVGPQPFVGEAGDPEPNHHVGVAQDLHVLAPELVDEDHARNVARQHDEHDDERRVGHLVEPIAGRVDDVHDIGVEESVRIEDDVEEEPVPCGAGKVPSVAPHGLAQVDAAVAVLAGLRHLLEGLALVHLHPEVKGNRRDDGAEGKGEAPGELQGGAGIH
mmetsp:Transcript_128000/g.250656  ORF Transcript_128000/g.250656 Transcript_128000/m.250656 type:complete len:200 (-) Transcript_128000:413-1012(-)